MEAVVDPASNAPEHNNTSVLTLMLPGGATVALSQPAHAALAAQLLKALAAAVSC